MAVSKLDAESYFNSQLSLPFKKPHLELVKTPPYPKDEELSFYDLQAIWYEKLKESGFEDIEHTSSRSSNLKTCHSSYFQLKYDPSIFEAQALYFEQASHFLHDFKHFESRLEKRIWAYHANGSTLREIQAFLESEGVLKMKKDTIAKIIQKLLKIMKNQGLPTPE